MIEVNKINKEEFMFATKNSKMPFRGVAMGLIVFGVIILSVALACWFVSIYSGYSFINAPFEKLIGGTIIAGIGYVVLELELLRDKN
jgi:hypothetical protein